MTINSYPTISLVLLQTPRRVSRSATLRKEKKVRERRFGMDAFGWWVKVSALRSSQKSMKVVGRFINASLYNVSRNGLYVPLNPSYISIIPPNYSSTPPIWSVSEWNSPPDMIPAARSSSFPSSSIIERVRGISDCFSCFQEELGRMSETLISRLWKRRAGVGVDWPEAGSSCLGRSVLLQACWTGISLSPKDICFGLTFPPTTLSVCEGRGLVNFS